MATIKPLLAKVLIQVGADEPKEIGTIEIPIEVGIATKTAYDSEAKVGAEITVDAEEAIENLRSKLGNR